MHLYNFHLKHVKKLKTTPTCFELFRSSSGSFVVPSQLHSLQQIPTQHNMLSQHLVYKNEINREYVITLARNDETP